MVVPRHAADIGSNRVTFEWNHKIWLPLTKGDKPLRRNEGKWEALGSGMAFAFGAMGNNVCSLRYTEENS